MSKDLEELKNPRKEQGSSGMTKGRVYGQIIAFKISLCIGLLLEQKKVTLTSGLTARLFA